MSTITVKDGTEIYYKDWGSGQPIVFSHGWPLSADDWDTQMLFFLSHDSVRKKKAIAQITSLLCEPPSSIHR
jgi:pimeloyl-ACP methyl ester carboxylesterase